MRPTVHDIAREAGVSLATVDRVLNARPGVRAVTVEKVQSAIRKLGYVRDLSAANLARQRNYRFLFLLPDTRSQFVEGLRAAIEEAAAALQDRTQVVIQNLSLGDPYVMLRTLAELASAEFDGVAIMANETPVVRDVIARLKARKIAVVSLVTDQPNSARDHFVGIDNVAAGRTAARLLGRFLEPARGRILVVVNTMLARDMIERRLGFDAVMAESFPDLAPLPSVEGHDDWELTARVAAKALSFHDGIVGIYAVGAGMRGVTRAVETARHAAGRPVVVGHELTPHSRQALETGAVDALITQDAGHLARSALRVLRAKIERAPILLSQERIRIEIVLKENLPREARQSEGEETL